MEQIRLSSAAFEGDNNVYLFDGDETVLVNYLGVEWFERRSLSSAARGHRPLAGSSDGVHRSLRKSPISQTPRHSACFLCRYRRPTRRDGSTCPGLWVAAGSGSPMSTASS
jgi:hypothetical protein